jgi:hypothetical protein
MAFDVSQPIPWQTVEDAIIDWVTTVTKLETQWLNQAEPQPAYPFAAVNIIGPSEIGTGDEIRTQEKDPGSDKWENESRGQREITVSVQIDVGPPDSKSGKAHARHFATRLLASLSLETIWRRLEAAGLSVVAPAPIQDLSLTIANLYTDRKVLEVRFYLASSVVEDIDVIERTTVSGEVERRVAGGTFDVGPIDIDSTP